MKVKAGEKRQRDDLSDAYLSSQSAPGQKVQCTVTSAPITQARLDKLILNYIVQCMRPLSTVEDKSFVELVEGLQQKPPKKVMTRKTLSVRLNEAHHNMLQCLRDKLVSASYVCTTADIWSTNNKSYFGVTVHWLSDDFQRCSAVLGCRRFKGSHTYNRIAELLSGIHDEVNLDTNKIVCTVTDNASNFKKAFKEYVTPVQDEDADENDAEEDEGELTLVDVDSVLKQDKSAADDDDEPDDYIHLPTHHKCVCHSLNLIATTDADEALSSPPYSRIYHGTMGKCQVIWNSARRSTKASDVIADICNEKKMVIPCPTRWNSKYDAVKRLLEFTDKIGAICDKLELPKLKPTEIDFLKEYVVVMEPIATILDQLQGDQNCYNGMLLPKLIQLRHKLHTITGENHLTYCSPLVNSLLNGLTSRFNSMFNLDTSVPETKNAILAAVSHPQYKLKWVPPEKRDDITLVFVEAVDRANKLPRSFCTSTDAVEEDEYGYGEANVGVDDRTTASSQAMNYLADSDKSLGSLKIFSSVTRLFARYNTALPSSAPVERLFSSAGLIVTPRRNRLTDSTFEKLLMLKLNSC